ncbi:hypothetical protein TrVFT333_005739 [Trichoderma virens FT-333]|nr:hypothetical protein TrVFT333_005739 [Trichoderma virens FT-333]
MAQHGFTQFGSGPNGGHIDPNDLAMSGGYSPSFANNNFNTNSNTNGFSSGSAVFGDDELLDGLLQMDSPASMARAKTFTA